MKWMSEYGALVSAPAPCTKYIIADNTLSVIYTQGKELKGDLLGRSGRSQVLKKQAEQHRRQTNG